MTDDSRATTRKQRETNAILSGCKLAIARRLLEKSRERASKKNIPFDLKASDITVPDYCPALGLRLFVGRGAVHDASPSLDRIRPEPGYVRGNVQVISHRANTLKNNSTPIELQKILNWLREG